MAITANSGAVSSYSGYSPPTVNGQNAYDLQRQQAASSNEAQRQAQQAAMKRRMAAQGLSGSGIEEKGIRNTDVAAETANAQQQGAIQQTELTQAEADQQAALQRAEQEQLQGESIAAQEQMQGTQIASTEKLAGQQLTYQQEQLAQQATQFSSQLDFNKWAAQQGFNEQDAQRAWQAAQNTQEQGVEMAMQGTQIGATAALQSQQIASTEKIQADAQAIQEQGMTIEQAQLEGYTDANGNHVIGSAELAAQGLTVQQAQVEGYTDPTTGQHVPGTNELTAMGQTNQMNIAQLGANEQTTLQNMVNTQQTGMADLQESQTLYNQQVTATAKSYYDMGTAKQQLAPSQLTTLQQTDPISYASYQDGLAGRSLTEWQNNVTNVTNYQNALLLDASKLMGTSGGQTAIQKIFNATTGTGIAPSTQTNSTQNTLSDSTLISTPQLPAATFDGAAKAGADGTYTYTATGKTMTFNPSDLSKYDFSTGQIYTNVTDFNNPAYTNDDSVVFTQPVSSWQTDNGNKFSPVNIQPGVYTVSKKDTSIRKWDTSNYGYYKQPVVQTVLTNKDDPSITYMVDQQDLGTASASPLSLSNNPTNFLSTKGKESVGG